MNSHRCSARYRFCSFWWTDVMLSHPMMVDISWLALEFCGTGRGQGQCVNVPGQGKGNVIWEGSNGLSASLDSGLSAKVPKSGFDQSCSLCFYRTQELFSVHIQHKDALRRPSHCPLGTPESVLCTWQDLAVSGEVTNKSLHGKLFTSSLCNTQRRVKDDWCFEVTQ